MGSARTEIERMRSKRGSSNASAFSRMNLQKLDNPVVGCGSMFRTDYVSRKGKWIQMTKLLIMIFIPILGGWAITFHGLLGNVDEKADILNAQDMALKSIYLGRLVYNIQQERDMSILYVSRIGPGTKTFLIQSFAATDKAFEELWMWPKEFAGNERTIFRTKNQLVSYINLHRANVSTNSEVHDELVFYTEIVDFIIEWMMTTIQESGFGKVWKSLIVFHKLTRCILDTGVERAYGSMFYALGNFPSVDAKDLYLKRLNRFNYNYKSASFYSVTVDPLALEGHEQRRVTDAITLFRNEVKFSDASGNYSSHTKAEDYFDNCTLRIDFLYGMHSQVSNKIMTVINASSTSIATSLAIYCVIVSVVILFCPIIVLFADSLVTNIQAYSKALLEATTKLDRDQSNTNSLIYQMLPKPVAESLKRSSTVQSEYFKTATVLFSSIVNFTQMSIGSTAFELIDLLNVLYTAIDEQIERYDVYKVETINDTYMVVSGVPIANGDRHASEIADFALNVLAMTPGTMAYAPKTRVPVQLQLGANSGPVSAGVVGTMMLRYCLFGDTVNIASRMKSYGMPNRIHISETTAQLLTRTGNFNVQSRGFMDIKGKGEMRTYWLLPKGATARDDRTLQQDRCLPGALGECSSSKVHLKPGPRDVSEPEVVICNPKRSISCLVAPDMEPESQHDVSEPWGDMSHSERRFSCLVAPGMVPESSQNVSDPSGDMSQPKRRTSSLVVPDMVPESKQEVSESWGDMCHPKRRTPYLVVQGMESESSQCVSDPGTT